MKKTLSIVFLVIPLLFFTYACGEETQAKITSTVEQVAPAVKNAVEKTKTVVEAVETATVEAVKVLEKDVAQAKEANTKEEKPVAETTEVTTKEEAPATESVETTTEEEAPATESVEVTTEEESLAKPVAMAVDLKQGAMLFQQNCAACHAGGGNLVNAMKTLKKEALVKYDMYSQEAIVYQVTNGKNAMPAFGSRLSSEQIENVAGYVLDQAEKGW